MKTFKKKLLVRNIKSNFVILPHFLLTSKLLYQCIVEFTYYKSNQYCYHIYIHITLYII